MDIKALQTRLRDFATARDWQPYHSPKNLAMALVVEAAELLELFQWLTTAESRTLTRDAADEERVGDEIADVLLYLLQLADHTDVDVEDAVERKLRKNAEKHPAKHPEKAAPGPKGHLLIDWENVQPRGEELRKLVPEGTDVWIFHGPLQKVDASSHRLAYGADKVVLIPRPNVSKKNALDFQLSYYIGYISARQPQEQIVVVSNDTGYDPMLEHARELGFDARRCEYRKPPKPPSPAPVLPKTQAAHTSEPEKRMRLLAAASPGSTINQIVEGAWSNLRTMPIDNRPRQPPEVMDYIKLFIGHTAADKDGLAQQAWQLLHDRGALLPPHGPEESKCGTVHLQRAPGKTLSTADAGTTAKKMPDQTAEGCVKVTRQEIQKLVQLLQEMPLDQRPSDKENLLELINGCLGERSIQSPRVAQALAQLRAQKHIVLKGDEVRCLQPLKATPTPTKKAPTKSAQSKAATKAPVKKTESSPLTSRVVVPEKKAQPSTTAQVAQRVLASLKKMSANKPARRTGLLKYIETHAAKAADPKAMAQQVCALLEARKYVVPSPDGKGVIYPKLEIKKATSPS